MHRCFQIPEILSLICDELHAMSSQSLVHLALTSRALSQQPLDKLWSRIDDLAILFNGCDGLLTGEEVFHGDYAHMEYSLDRPFNETDISKLKTFSARVRHLYLPIYPGYVASLTFETLASLKTTLQGESGSQHCTLFPNLRTIEIQVNPELETTPIPAEQISLLSMFIGPRLQSFTLENLWLQGKDFPLLQELAGQAPNLTDLTVDRCVGEAGYTIPLDILKAFPELKDLRTSLLSWETFPYLSSMPRLAALSTRILKTPQDIKDNTPLPSAGFRALEDLYLQCDSHFKDALQIISMLDSSALSTISVTSQGFVNLDEITSVLVRINERVDPAALAFIEIQAEPRHTREFISPEVTKEFTETLATLCKRYNKLDKLIIQPSMTPYIPLKLLTSLSTHLQKLSTFSFVGGPVQLYFLPEDGPEGKGYTQTELLDITRMLPQITELGVPFDSSSIPNVPSLESRPGAGYSHTYLHQLNVGSSPLSDIFSVSLFLSDVFPNLTEIESDEPWLTEEFDHHSKWRVVKAMIPNFVVARMQSRVDVQKKVNKKLKDAGFEGRVSLDRSNPPIRIRGTGTV